MIDDPTALPGWVKLLAMGVTAGSAGATAYGVLRYGAKGRAAAVSAMAENFAHLEETLGPLVTKVDRIHVELVGYTGADGLLADMKLFRQDLGTVKDELATVDARITASRHLSRNENGASILVAEARLDRIIAALDGRIADVERTLDKQRGGV